MQAMGQTVTLKLALETKGYSISQFAKLLGISRQAIYQWIAGGTYPSNEHLKDIQKILGQRVTFNKKGIIDAENNCLT